MLKYCQLDKCVVAEGAKLGGQGPAKLVAKGEKLSTCIYEDARNAPFPFLVINKANLTGQLCSATLTWLTCALNARRLRMR